jgi:acyl-CoA synthetase (AMP-forming)/AMP-acid ligase II
VPFAKAFIHSGTQYLPTGDIGIFAGGELFPVDRISDTIILYGAKIHAADVEATVLDDPQARDVRAAAAFATDDGRRERLVLLCEIDRRSAGTPAHARLAEYVPNRIAEIHGVVPTVKFVTYGSLPRTSSGKIKRAASRAQFLCGEARLLRIEAGV